MANVWSSAKILEFDYAGIEAKLLGWFMRDPAYMRLAALGMHAYVASHVMGDPADLSWPDDDLAAYFRDIKHAKDAETQRIYKGSKRVVHGNGYGQTVMGVFLANQDLFPTMKKAQEIFEVYFAVAPNLPTFHTAVRHTAHEQGYLGGAEPYDYQPEARKVVGHPYQYLHWFNSVVRYERLTEAQRLWRSKRTFPLIEINGLWYGIALGEDAKRCVAFYPQGTARGVLTEASFPLFDPDEPAADQFYIGDVYYGDTPLRAPIHDSLMLEVPTRKVDLVIERVVTALTQPIRALPCPLEWGVGACLTVGVDGAIGDDWGSMEDLDLANVVASDVPYSPAEDEDEEDVEALEVPLVRTA